MTKALSKNQINYIIDKLNAEKSQAIDKFKKTYCITPNLTYKEKKEAILTRQAILDPARFDNLYYFQDLDTYFIFEGDDKRAQEKASLEAFNKKLNAKIDLIKEELLFRDASNALDVLASFSKFIANNEV